MRVIVETRQELEDIKKYQDQGIFLHIIKGNKNYHEALCPDIGVYVYLLEDKKEIFINIEHSEALKLKREWVYEVIRGFKSIYVVNKKDTFYYYRDERITDLSIKYEMIFHKRLEEDVELHIFNMFYNKYPKVKNLNSIIPIVKHIESGLNIYKRVEKIIMMENPSGFEFYNKKATEVFYNIEKIGIKIDRERFIEVYKVENPEYNIEGDKVYTKYNLTNITSRPTNAFNSINFLAIPKKPEYRECILPENDVFLELDYDGYHLRILAEETGVNFDKTSIHEQLGREYFNKTEITEDEYLESKKVSFQKLYGIDKSKKYNKSKLFAEVEGYKTELYRKFEENGKVYNRVSNKEFKNSIESMNPEKLLNYMIQSLETSLNIKVLEKVNKLLENQRSNIILYTYDSIILDFDLSDGKEVLIDIAKEMEDGGKYPIKWKQSKNLVL